MIYITIFILYDCADHWYTLNTDIYLIRLNAHVWRVMFELSKNKCPNEHIIIFYSLKKNMMQTVSLSLTLQYEGTDIYCLAQIIFKKQLI